MQPPYVLVGSPIGRSFLLPPFICLTLEWSSFICPALFDHLASCVPTDLVGWSLQSVGREMRRKPEDFIDLASKDHFSPIGKENETKEENNSAKKKGRNNKTNWPTDQTNWRESCRSNSLALDIRSSSTSQKISPDKSKSLTDTWLRKSLWATARSPTNSPPLHNTFCHFYFSRCTLLSSAS